MHTFERAISKFFEMKFIPTACAITLSRIPRVWFVIFSKQHEGWVAVQSDSTLNYVNFILLPKMFPEFSFTDTSDDSPLFLDRCRIADQWIEPSIWDTWLHLGMLHRYRSRVHRYIKAAGGKRFPERRNRKPYGPLPSLGFSITYILRIFKAT